MKYTVIIISLFVLAVLATACNKGDQGQPGVLIHTPVYVPSSLINIYNGGYDNHYFYYDSKARLIELKDVTNFKTTDAKLTYNDNDQIVQATWADSNGLPTSTSKFAYYADSIVEDYATPGYVGLHIIHSLNTKKQIIKQAYNNGSYDNFKYDDRGNMIAWDRYISDHPGVPAPLFSSITFVYDNNKSPFTNVRGNYILALNHYTLFGLLTNNMLSYSSGTTSFVYNFDSNGFPTHMGPLFSGTLTYILQ